MATGQLNLVLHQLRKTVRRQLARGLADGELLERFLRKRDEAAFEVLVWRHGPLVLSLCHRLLHNSHDAEDVLQATFLTLVKKAGAIGKRDSLGSWLYKVAYRIALRVREATQRRRESDAPVDELPAGSAPGEVACDQRRLLLEEAIDGLPEHYRTATVLCYMQGKSHKEIAEELGCPLGTVSTRLARAREMLRKHFARRGVALSAGLLGAFLAQHAVAAPVCPLLVVSLVKAATSVAAGSAVASVVSAKVAALTEGMVTAMFVTKLKIATTLLLVAGFVLGAGTFGHQSMLAHQPIAAQPAAEKQAEKPQATDGKGAPPAKQPLQPPGVAEGTRLKLLEQELTARAAFDLDLGQALAEGKSLELLDQALAAAAAVKDPEQKARLLIVVAKAQAKARALPTALKTLQRAFELGNALPIESVEDFLVRDGVLSGVSDAQADMGDFDGALKTLEADRKPKADDGSATVLFWKNSIADARARIAYAQARAGKYKEALEAVSRIDDERSGFFKCRVLMETARAQAQAGDWKQAQTTVKSIEHEGLRIPAWVGLAKLQAKAGMRDAARASIAEGLKAVPPDTPDDNFRQSYRAEGLQGIALAQADMGDLKIALRTADSIPESRFPYKAVTLALLRARAGDYKGAKDAAREIDGGLPRATAFLNIARAQAGAKDFKGAMETADAILRPFSKAVGYLEIAEAQARAGDRGGATKTFAKVRELAEAVPETPDTSDPDRVSVRPRLLQRLASAEAEVGEEKAAQTWIDKLSSPNLRAWAFVGLADGIAKRAAAK
jgi:RNA polymerase sigma factor (sigma-70 family)